MTLLALTLYALVLAHRSFPTVLAYAPHAIMLAYRYFATLLARALLAVSTMERIGQAVAQAGDRFLIMAV